MSSQQNSQQNRPQTPPPKPGMEKGPRTPWAPERPTKTESVMTPRSLESCSRALFPDSSSGPQSLDGGELRKPSEGNN